jgi:hypothetical protein
MSYEISELNYVYNMAGCTTMMVVVFPPRIMTLIVGKPLTVLRRMAAVDGGMVIARIYASPLATETRTRQEYTSGVTRCTTLLTPL